MRQPPGQCTARLPARALWCLASCGFHTKYKNLVVLKLCKISIYIGQNSNTTYGKIRRDILGRLVIVPRLALTARRAAGGTAGAAATWGYLGRPLASLPCTGRHLFDLRRELQMCPQICSPWSLGSTPSKPTETASAYLRALRAPRAWSRAGACAA